MSLYGSKKAFLFDLDDTLIDSGSLHEAAYRMVLARHHLERLLEFDYASHQGRKTADVFRSLGVGDEKVVNLLTEEKQAEYRRSAEIALKALPNAIDLLGHLRKNNRRLFLVTSSSATSVKKGLIALNSMDFFEGMVTAEDVTTAKPSPEPYLFCMHKYKLDVSECVAIEDSPNGVLSAQKAGLDVMGVHNLMLKNLVKHFYADLFALGEALDQPFVRVS